MSSEKLEEEVLFLKKYSREMMMMISWKMLSESRKTWKDLISIL
jgi:hypothetical protein